jgi:hypothetical protein
MVSRLQKEEGRGLGESPFCGCCHREVLFTFHRQPFCPVSSPKPVRSESAPYSWRPWQCPPRTDPRPQSPYLQFLGPQLRLGMSMDRAVAAANCTLDPPRDPSSCHGSRTYLGRPPLGAFSSMTSSAWLASRTPPPKAVVRSTSEIRFLLNRFVAKARADGVRAILGQAHPRFCCPQRGRLPPGPAPGDCAP